MSRSAPAPLLSTGKSVDWWFVFKLNSAEEQGDPKPPGMKGIFDVDGWQRPAYEKDGRKFSQHYLFASSAGAALQHGKGILGTSLEDPVGATFGRVYDGDGYYVLWNDQFYGDPRGNGRSPWGHSKGMVAWNDDGEGVVMQVSTPSWPAAGRATATPSVSSRTTTSRSASTSSRSSSPAATSRRCWRRWSTPAWSRHRRSRRR